MDKPEKESSVVFVRLDRALKKEFQVNCMVKGVSMQELVREWIADFNSKEGTYESQRRD